MPVNEKTVVWCGRYTEKLIPELQAIHNSSQFHDVTLKVENVEFGAHKIILAANSPYFKQLFTSGKGAGKSHYHLHSSVKFEPFESILDYFYSGSLELSFDNVEDVLKLAKYLKVEAIGQVCLEYLLISLDEDNCMQCLHMAEKYNWEELRSAAEELILGGNLEIFEKEGFFRLKQDQIAKILKSNKYIGKAESVFNAIVKWVEYDEKNREEFMLDLLQLLPMSGLSKSFRAKMMRSNQTVRNNAKTLQWLIDSLSSCIQLVAMLDSYRENSFFIADALHEDGQIPCFQVKCSNPNAPVALPRPPELCMFSSVCYKENIYLLYGTWDETGYKFENSTETWMELDFDMDFKRYNPGTVLLNDTLYVIGGVTRNPYSYKSSVYRSCRSFDFNSLVKSNFPAMKEQRMKPGVAIHENSLYAAGGRFSLNTIERFDPREGTWYTVGRLDKEANIVTCAVCDNTLYSCLLESGQMEAFDLRAYQLKQIRNAAENKYRARIASVDNELYACLKTEIVKYDPSRNDWNVFCNNLNVRDPVIVTWNA